MKQRVIKGGVILGLGVGLWTWLMGLTGWYKHPTLLNLFWMVVVIQIAVLVVTLRGSARDGRGYGGQVIVGTLASVLGSGIIFCASMLFTTVLFPHYFEELQAMQRTLLAAQGLPEAEIVRQTAETARTQTPFISAISGVIGTIVTGIIASSIIAIFVRARGPVGTAATS